MSLYNLVWPLWTLPIRVHWKIYVCFPARNISIVFIQEEFVNFNGRASENGPSSGGYFRLIYNEVFGRGIKLNAKVHKGPQRWLARQVYLSRLRACQESFGARNRAFVETFLCVSVLLLLPNFIEYYWNVRSQIEKYCVFVSNSNWQCFWWVKF